MTDQTETVFCTDCGKALPASARFCRYCGTATPDAGPAATGDGAAPSRSIDDAPRSAAPDVAPAAGAREPIIGLTHNQVRSNLMAWLVVASLAFAACLGGYIYILYFLEPERVLANSMIYSNPKGEAFVTPLLVGAIVSGIAVAVLGGLTLRQRRRD